MGALTGLKILDFSTLLPGPFATLFLADLGAEVLRVEAPNRVALDTFAPPLVDEGYGASSGLSTITSYLGRNKRSLFLDMKTNPRDKAANADRREIRKALTEADIHAYAAETGLPAGFLAWLMLDDEWYEVDWEEGDDWREGRRDWDFADWVDASDLREKYGKEAVVTEDEVERVLRKNGYRFDD